MLEPHMHLLLGIRKGLVGSPLMPIPLAGAPAVGFKGQGAAQTLINLATDTDLTLPPHHVGHPPKVEPGKLGKIPETLLATIYGVGFTGAGPLVGVASWGSGNGAQQSIEFDVPIGGGTLATAQTAGGAILAVPATSLTIQVRNDGNVIPPVSTTPVGTPIGSTLALPATPPTATCAIAPGYKQGNAQLTRTIWAANGPLAPAGSVVVDVPPWAQRFRVLRFDAGNAISVIISTLGTQTVGGPYNEAANAPPSVYSLPNNASTIQITNTGAAPLNFIALVFELGL